MVNQRMNVQDHFRKHVRIRLGPEPKCPACGTIMLFEKPSPEFRGRWLTLDHILPKARGGTTAVINRRAMCALCNEARGLLNHCVGALACSMAVNGRAPLQTIAKWKAKWPKKD